MSGTAAGGVSVRVALIGMGRMGRALDALAPERGCEVVARLDAAEMSNGITAADLRGAQVAIAGSETDAGNQTSRRMPLRIVIDPPADSAIRTSCPDRLGESTLQPSSPA